MDKSIDDHSIQQTLIVLYQIENTQDDIYDYKKNNNNSFDNEE